jgi:polar amino acid transport system permease protein
MGDVIGLLAFGSAGWSDELLAGAAVTIALALATLPFSLGLGLAVALLKRSDRKLSAAVGHAYTTVFRGLPELLTLLMIYYGAPLVVQATLKAVGVGARVEPNAFFAGVLALSLVSAAFTSEVFLSAFNGISRGQWEGAYALGLNRRRTLGLVILPQLVRLSLPGLSNSWLVLLKDTSLVSIIALEDLLRATNLAVGATKQPFLFYTSACCLYLMMTGASALVLRRIETRAERPYIRSPA